MSPAAPPSFDPRPDRPYDHQAVATFPWPVVACYDAVHTWMDQDLAVYAAWQLRDAWEALLKFLATAAVADHLAAAPADDPRTSPLLARLLKPKGLATGDWPALLELALKQAPAGGRLHALQQLLFPARKPRLMPLFVGGNEDQSFVTWRNRRLGHGVLGKNLGLYVRDVNHWLEQLHDAYDLCRDFLAGLTLESDDPAGGSRTWGPGPPLPFYHPHQPDPNRPAVCPVRLRLPDGGPPLELTPLLSVQRCGVCGQWAAFYLDKFERDKARAWFLDFVDGHSHRRGDLAVLGQWANRVRPEDWNAVLAAAAGEADEPDPRRFRDFEDEFEPPVYLAERIAAFLNRQDRGVVVLTGPAGVGKSWASQGLGRPEMLKRFLHAKVELLYASLQGFHPPTAGDVKAILAEQARRKKAWQVPAEPDGPAAHDRFAGWLAAVMRQNGHGRLLVVLDGLDDLPADSDVPELWPPADRLPPGCYMVLATRPERRAAAEAGLRRVRSAADHCLEVALDPRTADHGNVLRRYALAHLNRPRADGQPLPAAWADALIERAGRTFLYVFHYCRALHFGVYGDLAELPPPEQYYPQFFQDLRVRVGERLFEDYYARTLALIAVAREPIGLAHLTAWGLERARLLVVMDDLAELLHSRREPWDSETLYRLGHDTIREFLTGDAAWRGRLAKAEQWLVDLARRLFADDWAKADPFALADSYLLFHILDHATEPDERHGLLDDSRLADVCCGQHCKTLADQRHYERALDALQVALTICEEQVLCQGQSERRPNLAKVYQRRGAALCNSGRLEESVKTFNTCLTLYEQLVQEQREELRSELALAYGYRGIALDNLGRLEEALQAHDACIALYERLVHGEGQRELRSDLATAYEGRGTVLKELRRHGDALQAYEASTTLHEQLVHGEGRRELRHQLAHSYIKRGVALRDLGRLEETLGVYDTCTELYEQLVQREGRKELRHDLAYLHMARGVALAGLNRMVEALQAYDACIALREQLVYGEGHRGERPELAIAYLNRGSSLHNLGRPAEALPAYDACIVLYEQLVQQDGRLGLRRILAAAYENRGRALGKLGRQKEEAQAYDACIALYEQLVQREGRKELRRDLVEAYSLRGPVLYEIGRLEETLRDYDARIAIEEQLVYGEGRQELRRDLATAYKRRGQVLGELGRQKEEVQAYGACIALREQLIQGEGQQELRPELATAYRVRGFALQKLGQLEWALQSFDAEIAVYERLVRGEGRQELRFELAKAYFRRGMTLDGLGRREEELTAYDAGISLCEQLKREGSVEVGNLLASAYPLKANILLGTGQRSEAARLAREAILILQAEVARTRQADLQEVLGWANDILRRAGG
jgi:tetratricopeptide (TPR) repeat protein